MIKTIPVMFVFRIVFLQKTVKHTQELSTYSSGLTRYFFPDTLFNKLQCHTTYKQVLPSEQHIAIHEHDAQFGLKP